MAKHIQTRGRFGGRPDPTSKVFSQMNNPEIDFAASKNVLVLNATEFGHKFHLEVDLGDGKSGEPSAVATVTMEGQSSKPHKLAAFSSLDSSSNILTVRCFELVDTREHYRWFTSRFQLSK